MQEIQTCHVCTQHSSNKLDALSGSRIEGTPILALSNYYRQQQTTCSPPPPALEPMNPSFTALVHARQRPLLPSDAVTRVRRPLVHSSIEIVTLEMLVAQPPNQTVTSVSGTGSCLERPRPFSSRTVLRARCLRLVSETFAQSQLFFKGLYFMS
ncbi:hypothetical protein BDP81DRAFT_178142 [Colletotrichum phormii]|uniref:Uncharacterized protein n=1 Tax=Colletotrichum phormii TaxID=359342 RepID=A0AAJ0EHY6_9PEZI|nr:uncharacterized protein BDP81DRAFT_178142 [Colletotrichum phormii]KAK1639489.1 hypothetical protein BDP81DRAFT_178142 [Colletotrichum phormii]